MKKETEQKIIDYFNKTYKKTHQEMIAIGVGRIVFSKNKNTVIKMSYSLIGNKQNNREYISYEKNKNQKIAIVKKIEHAKESPVTFLEMEKMIPLDKLLKGDTKYDKIKEFKTYEKEIEKYIKSKENKQIIPTLQKIFENEIEKNIIAAEEITPENIGCKDNKLYLIDYGINKEDVKEYYTKDIEEIIKIYDEIMNPK